MRRILFFAEAVTLAHVTRPWVLARSLDPNRYEIHFASAPGYDRLFNSTPIIRHGIRSISSENFLDRLAKGTPLYRYAELKAYMAEDLAIIDRVRPDLVVGDFRLSLAVSSPLRSVPYAVLTNAHWSPYNVVKRAPFPEHPLAHAVGVRLASRIFHWVQGAVFAAHSRPLNRLRRDYGLAPLGSLPFVYTHGDYTLYLDLPSLVPTEGLAPTHRYLGPVLWSPPEEPPEWWADIPLSRPCIYVTLGSSGAVQILQTIIEALADLPISVLVATAGRLHIRQLPENVWVDRFLPGTQAAHRSSAVICNGGSATAYQALAEGVPVLGIPTNMDQYFTMEAIVRAGAGRLVRAGEVTRMRVREAVRDLLDNSHYKTAARVLARECKRYDAISRFGAFTDEFFAVTRDNPS